MAELKNGDKKPSRVLQRAVFSSRRLTSSVELSAAPPVEDAEDSIVGLDDIGDEDDEDRNLELQDLGLSKQRAKSFAKLVDPTRQVSRTEEIVYIGPNNRLKTLRAQELEAWFASLNPKSLSADFRLSRGIEPHSEAKKSETASNLSESTGSIPKKQREYAATSHSASFTTKTACDPIHLTTKGTMFVF